MFKINVPFNTRLWLMSILGQSEPQSLRSVECSELIELKSAKYEITPCVRVVSRSVSQRNTVEAFIRKHCHQSVASQSIESRAIELLPALLTVYCQQSQHLLAALGLRYADQSQLACESVMEVPIQLLLADHLLHPVNRIDIIELGHFALLRPEHLVPVLRALIGFIKQLNGHWIIYQASDTLQKGLEKLGVSSEPLAADTRRNNTNHMSSLNPELYYCDLKSADMNTSHH